MVRYLYLLFSESNPVPGINANDLGSYFDDYQQAVLKDFPLVYVIKKMGDIFNHLFQNKQRMVARSLCTESQYYFVVIKLVGRMYITLEYLDVRKHVIVVYDNNKVKNNWDDDKEFFVSIYKC